MTVRGAEVRLVARVGLVNSFPVIYSRKKVQYIYTAYIYRTSITQKTRNAINFAEIICPTPSIPKSGRIIEQTNRHNSGRKQHQTRMYKVGALVRFACVPGHQLLGEASVICTENGTWSHPPPVCKFPYRGHSI